jgi:Lrp/AsnC family transcriptional regulator for asnA, asnC and gidA
MKKLEQMGIVKNASLDVDHVKLGYDICAYLGIYLDKSSLYTDVSGNLSRISEVVSAHYTTGLYNIFAKIICEDTNHLRSVLNKIQRIEGIQRTETFISLENSIERPVQLLSGEDDD